MVSGPLGKPPPLSVHNHSRGVTNLDQVEKILTDYQESGSIKVVKDSKTLHLIPWFLISKPDLGRGSKMEVNSRLQRVKPTLHTLPLQTRSSPANFSKFKKRRLGGKSGPEGCLLSCTHSPRLETLLKTSNCRKI